MQERLDDLNKRKEEALQPGAQRSVDRQHEKGKLLARERIEYLLDPGSFHELDMLARHRAHNSGIDERPLTDGVITGWGTIDGRKIFRQSVSFGLRQSIPEGEDMFLTEGLESLSEFCVRSHLLRSRSRGSVLAPSRIHGDIPSAAPATGSV